jgi:hypothetical protein
MVLMSWYYVTSSAYVFALSGSELKHVTIAGLQLADAIFDDRDL